MWRSFSEWLRGREWVNDSGQRRLAEREEG